MTHLIWKVWNVKIRAIHLAASAVAAVLCLVVPLCQGAVPGPDVGFESYGGNTYIRDKNSALFLGEIKKDQKFLIIRYGRNRADINVYVNGKLIYKMPDEAVDYSGHWSPGETSKGYNFYLSPDHRYLFVVRGLTRGAVVAYLYTKTGPGRMKPIQRAGLRLEEAALHYFCRHKRIDENLLWNGSRNVHFVGWDMVPHRLIFTMSAASYWSGIEPQKKGDVTASWYTAYNLKMGSFKIITHTDGLPEPQE